MQRRSGNLKIVPDQSVITSLDLIIHDERKLGEGGFARVCEADWRGTKVAVKLMDSGTPSFVCEKVFTGDFQLTVMEGCSTGS